MQIAIVLYPGCTALDAIGPYEVLRLLPERRGALRRRGARTGRRRQRGAVPRRHPQLRRDPGTGHRAGAWLRSADRDDDGRPAADRLAAAGARDDAMDDVGLHRGDDPGRRGHPGRAAGDDPLDDAVWAGRHGRQATARGTDRARRQGRHRGRRVGRPRPRPVAGRRDRRPGAGRDDPALHRVRPAAAVPRRPPEQGQQDGHRQRQDARPQDRGQPVRGARGPERSPGSA